MSDSDHDEADIWEDETANPVPDETPAGRAEALWRDVWVATTFLTRLPLPGALIPPGFRAGGAVPPLAGVVRAFPMVGILVGLLGAFGIWVAYLLGLHPLGAAFLCLGAASLATGALHEDGLADVADGFGGGVDRDDKLSIMRDSTVGTFGVLAMIFSVGLRAGALMSLTSPTHAAFAFIGAAVMSRAALPALMHLMAPAREDGLGHDAGRPAQDGVITAMVLGLLIGFLVLGFWATVMAALFVAAAVCAVGLLATRQVGGQTGDVLGAAQQAGEVAALFAIVAVLG